jgi:hypothetical protein
MFQVNNWLKTMTYSQKRGVLSAQQHTNNIRHHYTKLMYVGWRSSLRKIYRFSQSHIEVILVHCCR